MCHGHQGLGSHLFLLQLIARPEVRPSFESLRTVVEMESYMDERDLYDPVRQGDVNPVAPPSSTH